jgi:glyoxylase I family protein
MKIEHVALQVPDPVEMAQWYVRNLGCSIARSTREPLFVHFLLDDSGQSMIEIYRNPQASIPDYGRMDPQLLHLAFVSDEIRADRDRLVAAGASIVQDVATTPAGDEIMMMRDPWGVALQLVKRANPMLARP